MVGEHDAKTFNPVEKNYNVFIEVERVKDGARMMIPEGAFEEKHFRKVLKEGAEKSQTEKNLQDARIEAGLIDVSDAPDEAFPDTEDPEAGFIEPNEVPERTSANIEDPEEGLIDLTGEVVGTEAPEFITIEEAEALDYQDLRSLARKYQPGLKGQNKKKLLLSIVTGTLEEE